MKESHTAKDNKRNGKSIPVSSVAKVEKGFHKFVGIPFLPLLASVELWVFPNVTQIACNYLWLWRYYMEKLEVLTPGATTVAQKTIKGSLTSSSKGKAFRFTMWNWKGRFSIYSFIYSIFNQIDFYYSMKLYWFIC